MTFGNERVLYVLGVLLPLLVLFLYGTWRRRQRDMALFVQSRLLGQLTVGVSEFRRKARMALVALAVVSVMLALARPRWGHDLEEVTQTGLDIIVAIDTSRSMLAEDINPNRLARAKLAALELMALARTDRLGVEAFAGSAFLQCPLTFDDEAFRESVNALDVSIIPQGGTALAEAIKIARESFKSEDGNPRVLLLFTDGEDHEKGVVEAAKEAAGEGIRIFTVGVGTPEGEMLRQTDEKGANAFIKDEEGNAVKSRLDEKTLRDIAAIGRGFYLQLRGANTMDMLYQRGLAPLLEGQTGENNVTRMVRHFTERFQWPLGFAILLFMIEALIPDRKRPRKNEKSMGREKVSWMTAAALCMLLSLASAQGSAAKALDSYKNQKYESAWKEYEQLLSKKPKDPRLAYNAGAAAFQAGKYQEAETRFSDALISPDISLQERAYYNLGNSLYRQGEHAEDPAAKQGAWEKALQQYDSALKLDPKDEDAAFNKGLVKKKLEELKQKQDKKDDKSDNKDKKEDQKNEDSSKNEDKKDPEKKDPPQDDQKKDDSKKDQKQDKQNGEKKDPGSESQKKDPQQDSGKKDEAKQDQKKPDDQPSQKGASQDKSGDKQKGEAAATAQGVMTPEQAKQLLDTQKSNDKIFPYILKEKANPNRRIFKEW